jgi:hypothetical protein
MVRVQLTQVEIEINRIVTCYCPIEEETAGKLDLERIIAGWSTRG